MIVWDIHIGLLPNQTLFKNVTFFRVDSLGVLRFVDPIENKGVNVGPGMPWMTIQHELSNAERSLDQ